MQVVGRRLVTARVPCIPRPLPTLATAVIMNTATQQQVPAMELDRSKFTETLRLPALRAPKQHCSQLMKTLRGYTLDKPRLRCVVPDGPAPDGPTKLLLLSETLDPADLPQKVLEAAQSLQCEVISHDLILDYTYLTTDQVLKRVLPPDVEAPSSFETIGHIAHLNLRREQLPYKFIIGQVLLDKNPHIKTVVNKVGSIENEFRVFTMELLAGEDRTETEVVQHGLKFRLDFAQVYWNSRLETEHKRLVAQYFRPGQVVVDMMAGIGPFAIPAATQAGCQVYANDLNPNSARYMAVNVRLNKVTQQVQVFNMCGRDFVRKLCDAPPMQPRQPATELPPNQQQTTDVTPQPTTGVSGPVTGPQGNGHQPPVNDSAAVTDQPVTIVSSQQPAGTKADSTHTGGRSSSQGSKKGEPPPVPPPMPEGFTVPAGGCLFDHVVMNLPASAIEFLDTFNGAFDPAVWRGRLPLVHLYTFKKEPMTDQDVIRTMEYYLGGPLDEAPVIHTVRDVSPHKVMLCVTFKVPENVAFSGRGAAAGTGVEAGEGARRQGDGDELETAAKRQKV